MLGELEGVGRKVEEHPIQRLGPAQPAIRLGHGEADQNALFRGHRADNIRHGIQQLAQREWGRLALGEGVSIVGQFQGVVHRSAEAERGAVDEPKLAVLRRVDLAAPAPVQRFREEQDSRERAAKVVRRFDEQLECVCRGDSLVELHSAGLLQGEPHLLEARQGFEDVSRRRLGPVLGPAAEELAVQHLDKTLPQSRTHAPRHEIGAPLDHGEGDEGEQRSGGFRLGDVHVVPQPTCDPPGHDRDERRVCCGRRFGEAVQRRVARGRGLRGARDRGERWRAHSSVAFASESRRSWYRSISR